MLAALNLPVGTAAGTAPLNGLERSPRSFVGAQSAASEESELASVPPLGASGALYVSRRLAGASVGVDWVWMGGGSCRCEHPAG